MGPPTLGFRESPIAEFQRKLRECTLDALHGKQFVLTPRLNDWLRSKCPFSSSTQVELLLREVYKDYLKQLPDLPTTTAIVARGNVVIFSILLDIGHGDLIHEFVKSFDDSKLPLYKSTLEQSVREFISEEDGADAKLVELFMDAQWRYSCKPFQLDEEKAHPHQCILPIIRRQTINKKGATAHLWEIEVPEEFVGDTLRPRVQHSRYESQQYGRCYRFALKSFTEDNYSLFQNEKIAFHSLKSHSAMISCFGNFQWKEPGSTKQRPDTHNSNHEPHLVKTHNILFEYGEIDLEEFFGHNHPPLLGDEILEFWKTLSDIPGAVEAIHDLKTYDEGSSWKGWHADIKPDNILLVNGKFKLADPGFAKFVNVEGKGKRKDPLKLEEKIYGGTWTYAPPERCRGEKTPVTQTIDIWSLGCVFSIAATWVVGGYSAVRDFQRVRCKAIQRVKDNSKGLPPTKSADIFHDGEKVLPDVTSWHSVMRQSARQVDPITSRILDLVDSLMLCADPQQRASAKTLSTKFRQLLQECQPAPAIPIPDTIKDALLEIDEEAPSEPQHTPIGPKSAPSSGDSSDRQARKFKVLNQPLKRTAQRSEVLRSALSTSMSHFKGARSRSPLRRAKLPSTVTEDPTLQRHTSPPETVEATPEPPAAPTKHQQLQAQPTFKPPHEPQNVFDARKMIKQERKGAKNRVLKRKADGILSRYIKDRDIIFIVDNAETMRTHWAHTQFLLKTLVMKLRKLDENGMDLYFTFGSQSLKKEKVEAKFWGMMDNSNVTPSRGYHTDIERSIGDIFSKHAFEMRVTKKDLTFLILTDGVWDGMGNKDAIQDKIVELVKEAAGFTNHRKRSLTFQFIQFGEDEAATTRLRYLDNALAHERSISDVVDTEHAYGDVYKMILGSFIEEYDLSDVTTSPSNSSGNRPPTGHAAIPLGRHRA